MTTNIETVDELHYYGQSVIAKCGLCENWLSGCFLKVKINEVSFKKAPNDFWYRYIMNCEKFKENNKRGDYW